MLKRVTLWDCRMYEFYYATILTQKVYTINGTINHSLIQVVKMNKLNIKINLIFGYGIVLILMLAVSVIGYRSISQLLETSKWITHTQKVISSVQNIKSSMLDMETGKRGFLITGINEYLEPYVKGLEEFDKMIVVARTLTSGNKEQLKRLSRIDSLKQRWIEESTQPAMKLRREVNKGDSAIAKFKVISARTLGKELFDEIREKIKGLENKYVESLEMQQVLSETTIALLNMETGQRGFLLTGIESSLQPYEKGIEELKKHIKSLYILSHKTSLNSTEVEVIEGIVNIWRTKIADIEINARRVMNQYKYTMDDITKLMRVGRGKYFVDLIRLEIDNIILAETMLMKIRTSKQDDVASLSNNFILIGTSISLILSILIAFMISKNILTSIKDSKRKDKLLLEQSKLAAMGEMVGAIAHQWRQPLNALAMSSQFIIDDYEDKLIDKKYVDEYSKSSMKLINFMSKTIDDFRNFFRVDKIAKKFSIKEKIEETSLMLLPQLKEHNITLNTDTNDFQLIGQESEFQQVILNLINNAKDALIENQIEEAHINVEVSSYNEYGLITISDNAGGIPADVINRVFEPYFTTKEEGKGTGLGLYMSKMIVEDNMGGELHVTNEDEGAVFSIRFKLPKKNEKVA